MDVALWIGLITSLAAMVKAVSDALKAGIDLQAAKRKALDHASEAEKPAGSKELARPFNVKEDLLRAYVDDIKAAHERFKRAVSDPETTLERLGDEEVIARRSICKHLAKVKELNEGRLPSTELQGVWDTYGCGPA
jgi:hypothetical protein